MYLFHIDINIKEARPGATIVDLDYQYRAGDVYLFAPVF